MITEVSLWWVVFIVVCAAALYGLRFFKPSKEPKDQGFTDQITEGDGVYVGFVDKARPDLRNRPSNGTFWSSKYTPIWLRKKRKEEEEDPEKDQQGE